MMTAAPLQTHTGSARAPGLARADGERAAAAQVPLRVGDGVLDRRMSRNA